MPSRTLPTQSSCTRRTRPVGARSVAAPCGALLLLSACGQAPTPTPESYETPTPSASAGETFSRSGTFAGRFVVSQYVEDVLSIFDTTDYENQTITTYSVVWIEPGESPDTFRFIEDNCISIMTPVAGATSTMDPNYYENTVVEPRIATLSSTEIGATFTIPTSITLKGVELDDPENDALPTEPDDERLRDFDEDGHPGYTVYITGAATGQLYGSERYVFSYAGTVISENELSGQTTNVVESKFVESTSVLIPKDTKTYTDPDAARHFFQLLRLDDGATCQDVLDQMDTLFPE